MTPGRLVDLAKGLIALTKASPASMSTPEFLYERPVLLLLIEISYNPIMLKPFYRRAKVLS